MIRSPICALIATLVLGAASAAAAAADSWAGRPAPDFVLPAFAGSNVRLSEYRGEVVVLVFWGSRCSQCAAQLAALDALLATYGSAGLVALAVSVDDDEARAASFAHRHSSAVPLLNDRRKAVSRQFGVERLPSTILIDRGGQVRSVYPDFRAADGALVQEVRALLDDAPQLQ